jgi:uncharacterized protein (TIGR03435 family)
MLSTHGKTIGAAIFVFFCADALVGQATQTQPTFEVASVKQVDPDSEVLGGNMMRGGPGTTDPERIAFGGVTLRRLIMAAYGVNHLDEIAGPGWIVSERYAVTAKVPPGTTKQQFNLMLQNLWRSAFIWRSTTKPRM